ncbi:MAG: hypothetical protein J3Q66DRAFT_343482 [Benniella sp.]|nr:MAG: hypothetical protein J3Q66DRAFT_343482 [Benniella sp.]
MDRKVMNSAAEAAFFFALLRLSSLSSKYVAIHRCRDWTRGEEGRRVDPRHGRHPHRHDRPGQGFPAKAGR